MSGSYDVDGGAVSQRPPASRLDGIVDEIIATLLEVGSLEREQLVEAWGLSEGELEELWPQLVADSRIETRGQGRLFAVLTETQREAEEGASDPTLCQQWEAQVVERLVGLFQYGELEGLLDDLVYTLRQYRRLRTGEDRRGTKRELASALVLQHGPDLFKEVRIRRAIASACGVRPPGRWHPGKAGAIDFVRAVGFPPELAGLPSPDTPPDFEFLEGLFELKPLVDFQREIQRKLLEVLLRPGGRALVTLPTGAGKTRVAVESIRYWLSDRYDRTTGRSQRGAAIWLAHTEELCEQAYECFRQVWEVSHDVCPLLLVRFWGRYTQDAERLQQVVFQARAHPSLLVSTPNRLLNLLDGRSSESETVLALLRDAAGLIVIDEAHRAAATSYRRVLGALADDWERPHEDRVSVIGLTATPFRMEYLGDDPEEGTRELRAIFDALLEPEETLGQDARLRLQERGVLARPRFQTLETNTRIRLPGMGSSQDSLFALDTEEEIERIDRVLALRTDNTPRRLLLLEEVLAICDDPEASVLYFGPSVRDAECMAFLLRRSGIAAGVVSGRTRDVTRRQLVADFKERRLQVLCNCEVLTTGFDAPNVSHIVMARPTVSRVLYEQIVGRGLRGVRFGGTESCVILDCQDQIRGPRPVLGYEAFRRVWGV